MPDRALRRAAPLVAALLLGPVAGCVTPNPEADFCRQALIEVCANSCQGSCVRSRRALPAAAPRAVDPPEFDPSPNVEALAVPY